MNSASTFSPGAAVRPARSRSSFNRDGDRIFRAYFVNNRGDEAMGSTWSYLDLTALGRQAEWEGCWASFRGSFISEGPGEPAELRPPAAIPAACALCRSRRGRAGLLGEHLVEQRREVGEHAVYAEREQHGHG
jgi:hypothetical protein